MSFRKALAVVLLMLSCFVGVPVTTTRAGEKRDLSRYDKGGVFFLRHWYGEMLDDEAGAKARVRGFLWEKWRAKNPAYCSIVVGYTHGDGLTTTYFVEPDSGGRWRLVIETVSSCCSLDVMSGRKKEIEHQTRIIGEYYILSRMDAASGSIVPDQEKRKPESYTLLLRNGTPEAKDKLGPDNTHTL